MSWNSDGLPANGAGFWALGALFIATSFIATGCEKKVADPEKPQTSVEKAMPARVEPPSEEEETNEAAPANAEPSEAAANNAAVIDPSRIPVEEDFVTEAENRISKNANLEAELARIANEIKGAPAAVAQIKSKKD